MLSLLALLFTAASAIASPEGACRAAYAELGPLPIPLNTESYYVAWGFDLRRYRRYGAVGQPLPLNGNDPATFHAAVDLQAPAGTGVFLLRPGRIVKAYSNKRGQFHEATIELNEVDGDGLATNRFWIYTHLSADAVPAAVWSASDAGTTLPAGTSLGAINAWAFGGTTGVPEQIDVSNGARFDHLHLSLRVDEHFCNPLPFLSYADKEAPVVSAFHLLRAGTSEALGGDASGQAVDLVIEAYDLTTRNGQPSPFHLHNLESFELLVRDGNNHELYRNRWRAPVAVPAKNDLAYDEWRFPIELVKGEERLVMEGDTHGRRFFVRLNEKSLPVQWPEGPKFVSIRLRDFKGNVADWIRAF